MKMAMGLLADYANLSQEGKLNLLGIFQVIHAPSFPSMHLSMHLVLRFEAHRAEAGHSREVRIKLNDPDGRPLFELPMTLMIPQGDPALPVVMDRIIALNQVVFPKPGDYSFEVLVDHDHKGSVPLQLRLIPSDTTAGTGS